MNQYVACHYQTFSLKSGSQLFIMTIVLCSVSYKTLDYTVLIQRFRMVAYDTIIIDYCIVNQALYSRVNSLLYCEPVVSYSLLLK